MNEEQVGILVTARNMATGVLNQVKGELSGLGTAASGAGGHLGRLGSIGNALSGPLGHARGAISNLTSSLGLVGLSGALLGVGGLLKASIDQTQQFGLGVEKLRAVTGMTVETSSALIAVAEKYGVDTQALTKFAGQYEKAVGKLAETQAKAGAIAKSAALQQLEAEKLHLQAAGDSIKAIDKQISEQKALDALAAKSAGPAGGMNKLQALQKQYGVVLTDSAGRALSFQDTLLNLADAEQKAATVSEKARLAALASSIGMSRSLTTLAPLLSLGRNGILQAEQAAKDLGMTLDAQSAGSLAKYVAAQRGLGEATHALELQIGIGVMPVLTKFETGITGFLEHGGGQQIAGFFKGAADFASTFADALSQVLPLFGQLVGAFQGLPAPLRDILVGGFVAQKASSMLFGSGPLQWARGLLGGLGGGRGPVGAITGALAGAQPVNVMNWPPGLGLGGGGLASGISGAVEQGAAKGLGPIASLMAKIPGLGGVMSGGGILATVLPFVPAIIATVIASDLFNGYMDQQRQLHQQEADVEKRATDWRAKASVAQLAASNAGLQARLNELNSSPAGIVGGLSSLLGQDITGSEAAKRTIQDLIDKNNAAMAGGGAGGSTAGRSAMNVAIGDLRDSITTLGKLDTFNADRLAKITLGRGGGSTGTLEGVIAVLKAQEAKALKKGDTVAVKLLQSDIDALGKRLSQVTTDRLKVADSEMHQHFLDSAGGAPKFGPVGPSGSFGHDMPLAQLPPARDVTASIDASGRATSQRLDGTIANLKTIASTSAQQRDTARRQFTQGDQHVQQKIDQERAQLAGLLSMVNASLFALPAALKSMMTVNVTMTPPSARENKISSYQLHAVGGASRMTPA